MVLGVPPDLISAAAHTLTAARIYNKALIIRHIKGWIGLVFNISELCILGDNGWAGISKIKKNSHLRYSMEHEQIKDRSSLVGTLRYKASYISCILQHARA